LGGCLCCHVFNCTSPSSTKRYEKRYEGRLEHEVAKIHEDAKLDGHEARDYPNADYRPSFDQALISVSAAAYLMTRTR